MAAGPAIGGASRHNHEIVLRNILRPLCMLLNTGPRRDNDRRGITSGDVVPEFAHRIGGTVWELTRLGKLDVDVFTEVIHLEALLVVRQHCTHDVFVAIVFLA